MLITKMIYFRIKTKALLHTGHSLQIRQTQCYSVQTKESIEPLISNLKFPVKLNQVEHKCYTISCSRPLLTPKLDPPRPLLLLFPEVSRDTEQ